MSDLTEAGYLEQPHTSAGRVPTAEAYRTSSRKLRESVTSDVDQDVIESSLRGANNLQGFMERTSHVLSQISQKVGVAVAGPKEMLEHIHFTRSGAEQSSGGGDYEVRRSTRQDAAVGRRTLSR